MRVVPVSRAFFLVLAVLLAVTVSETALAHQPFFEETDTTASTPMLVSDPEISTALFSTLEGPGDVDFFAFTVTAGQTIEVGMTIPQISGQEEFAPTIGVIASGLDKASAKELPADALSLLSSYVGAYVLEPTEATIFLEPFSRTAYWRRQRRQITFPSDGEAVVVVWHPQGAVGRYTLVIGQREVLGGDIAFARKIRDYWTPVVLQQAAETDRPAIPGGNDVQQPESLRSNASHSDTSSPRCSWFMRLLSTLLGAEERCQ